MKVIFGIGNPGKNYELTRHNIGFQILDGFAEKYKLQFVPSKSEYWKVESDIESSTFILVKPTTYVNNSGLIFLELIEKYNLSAEDILVVVDDINLDLGKFRIRKSGGDGGHNGLKSIIYNIESNNFPRIRVGIANPTEDENLSDYVLSNFTNKETEIINNNSSLIIKLIENFIIGGTSQMLNLYSEVKNLSDKET
ncbi:MAG: aminoacyl-tRNA hydrolase [Ignavibacteriae bacterium]|nr:aminoacyl-tRNA hydrolase [Ignavibacteriota bacterium]